MNSALVTGGARGIGAAVARRLVADGFAVVIADVEQSDGELLETELVAAGGSARFILTDVTDPDAVDEAVGEAQSLGSLAVLVNNAAVFGQAEASELVGPLWSRIIAVNLTGAAQCVATAVPVLRAHGGSIINVVSLHANLTSPRLTAYAASKGGLAAMTRALALELAPDGIRVNAVLPGVIDTPMFALDAARKPDPEGFRRGIGGQSPLGRIGHPDDVAAVVGFLASPDACYITGVSIPVDGGIGVALGGYRP